MAEVKAHFSPDIWVEPAEKKLVEPAAEYLFQEFIAIIPGAQAIAMGQVKCFS